MPSDEVARDTIAAGATAPGRGGIGVTRVSGPGARAVAQALLGALPPPRLAKLSGFRDAAGNLLDRGLALFFPAPGSYTGEDVLELHGHGGPAVMRAILDACLAAGARLAEPGEFTRRAYLEGKLDLAQAEAVADLIDAASVEAARSAMRSLTGEFSRAVAKIQEQLTELRARAEAGLDFPEEEIDRIHADVVKDRLESLDAGLSDVLRRSREGSVLREGLHVVLAGAPNVGKSSLMNRLAGEERSIVTPVPGTTRDAVREPVILQGIPVMLVDTAGLRPASDPVERIGIDRARAELERADLVLEVRDAAEAVGAGPGIASVAPSVIVYNKIDLVPGFRSPGGALGVSAKTGEGLDALRDTIIAAAGASTGESGFLARARHLRALEEALVHVRAAHTELARVELMAEELRLAQDALSAITGEHSADDLLGEIFSRFCIGK